MKKTWTLALAICLFAVMSAQNAAPQVTADPSLILHLSFDELSGNRVTDHSQYRNHGTLVGNPQLADGKFGKALQFNGTSDWVEVPHDDSLTVDENVTVMAWIQTSRHHGPGGISWQGIIAKSNRPRSYSFYTEASGSLHLSVGDWAGSTSDTKVALNTWQHVVAQVDTGWHRYWINGKNVGNSQVNAPLPGGADTESVLIGRTHEWRREFLGLIDEVRIYNRALSEAEIIAQMNNGHQATTRWGDDSEGPLTEDASDAAAPVTVSVSPSPVQSPAVGEQLVLNLNITDGEDVAGYQATLQFDTTALRYVSSANGSYLPAGAFFIPPVVDRNRVTLAATSLTGGSHGDGTLATVTFEVIAVKPSVLTLAEVQLTDVDADFLSVNAKNGTVVESTQLRRDNVRLIYFRPSDRPRRQAIGTQLDTLIKDVQAFYAKQMQHHQAKTFTYETTTNGTAVVHYVDGQHIDTYYQNHTFNRVRGEIQEQFDISKHIYLVAIDLSSELVNAGTQGGVCGIGGGNWTSRDNKTWQRDAGGLAVIPASGTCFNLYVTAHELGHTFGLEHDFRDDNYLMAYGSQTRLSADAAEWLAVHPYFNALQTRSDQQTAFQMLSAQASGLNFQITDANGLHQAQLLIPTAAGDPIGGSKLHGSQALDGKTGITIKFVEPRVKAGQEVTLQVIDVQGNITKQTFSVETDSIAKVPDVPVGGNVATVSLPPSIPPAAIGDRLTLPITIAGGVDVAGYQLDIEFDVSALRYISSANADYLPAGAFVIPALVSGNRVTLAATALSGSSEGNGTLATLVFEVRTANPLLPRLSAAKLTDSNADFLEVRIENTAVTEPVQIAGDVNGDGIVNLEDMDAAADRLGQTGENTADVNGNGIVDAADLLLIAAAIEQGNAAPSLHSEAIVNMFTAAEVRQWLQLAWQQGLTGPIYQRGFRVLEQLLAILTPKETAVLPNYPNPFNPETWIPYHLSESAKVTVRIYAADGRLVRTLTVGHQSAGIYESRSRAAYWDGKNDVGEPVASGLYFYTLTAGDFAATRKLLIRK